MANAIKFFLEAKAQIYIHISSEQTGSQEIVLECVGGRNYQQEYRRDRLQTQLISAALNQTYALEVLRRTQDSIRRVVAILVCDLLPTG